MRSVLADSDILIEVSRARNSEILARWQDLVTADGAVLCSPVSVAEIWRGAMPREFEATEALFAGLVCVPVTAGIGRIAADYLRKYGRSHSMELGDALIAATASVENSLLWTRNLKHYPMRDIEFF